MILSRLRLAIWQSAPVLGDPLTNARAIADQAGRSGADLVLTPELSLTGYDLGDRVIELAVPIDLPGDPDDPDGAGEPLIPELRNAPDVVAGIVERGRDGEAYNAAVHLRGGQVLFRHRKVYLPTYGMFDEGRFFGRGGRVRAYDPGGGWRAGLLICEDFWHPSLPYILAAAGMNLLLVLAAAPGRGAWRGGEVGGEFASVDVWERMARTTAQLYGTYVALANRVGVEGGTTFAGGSVLVAPTGDVLARAAAGEELIRAEISLEEVHRARRPYFHGRDDDPALTIRELRAALEVAGD